MLYLWSAGAQRGWGDLEYFGLRFPRTTDRGPATHCHRRGPLLGAVGIVRMAPRERGGGDQLGRHSAWRDEQASVRW